jgi:hypothetical protein
LLALHGVHIGLLPAKRQALYHIEPPGEPLKGGKLRDEANAPLLEHEAKTVDVTPRDS